MKITQADLAVLARADSGVVQLDDRAIVPDPDVAARLIELQVVDKTGKLTTWGATLSEKAKKSLALFVEGIPIEKRKRVNPRQAGDWSTGKYKNKEYTCNADMVYCGKPAKGMTAEEGSEKVRTAVPRVIAAAGKAGKLIEVFPELWQMHQLDGPELIVFKSKDSSRAVVLQATYFDFLNERFKSAKFRIREDSDETGRLPVQVWITNKGWQRNIMALVMPVTG